jgi:hypothetical protein
MPQMFGNLSIRPKTVALLAVPVAGTLLLGGVGVGAGWGDRARATGDRRLAAAAGLAVVRAEVDRRLVTLERTMADLDRTVADLLEVTRQLTDRLDAPAAGRGRPGAGSAALERPGPGAAGPDRPRPVPRGPAHRRRGGGPP